MTARPHIVLGVTGSIAAYKAAELVRLMKKREWDVSVVMTGSDLGTQRAPTISP